MLAKNKPGKIFIIPKQCHPLTMPLWRALKESGMTLTELQDKSGVSRWTIKKWRDSYCPNIKNLEACLNAVGLRLIVVNLRLR